MKFATVNPEYIAFLTELKSRIAGARISADRTVNRERTIWVRLHYYII